MTTLDLDAIRAEVRALAYVRGTPAEAAMWGSGHRTGTDIRCVSRTYGSTLCVDDSSIPKASIGQL
jgi:hypothetical protein